MNLAVLSLMLLSFIALEHVIGILFFVMIRSYNIPVVILRFTGNKERPVLIIRRAKKKMMRGVPRLFVKGYKRPVIDFKSENYYPSPRTQHGGLVLWEFEDEMLTPVIPEKILSKLSPEQRAIIEEAHAIKQDHGLVKFVFDPLMYTHLRLKAVDDVDVEAMIDDLARQDQQYSPTWSQWLKQNGWMIGWLLLAIIMLVGIIFFFQKMPEIAATCASTAKTTMVEAAKSMVNTPPG